MTPTPNLALVDLDGTVADFDGEMRRRMGLLAAPGETSYDHVYGDAVPSYVRERRRLIKRAPGFWRFLPKLPMGFQVLDVLRAEGFALHVLTKGPNPAHSPNAWTEKAEWASEHIPDAAITIGSDKSLVYGKILFDDFPNYFEPWLVRRPRGLVICHAHAWNEEYASGAKRENSQILRYDGSPEAHERLVRAVKLQAGRD